MKPIHTPTAGGRKVNVLGIPMVIRIHGSDTGGVVSAVESHDVPGGGPPPHIHHREDETFQILEGEYEWTVGGKTFVAQKGATIFAPPAPYLPLPRPDARSSYVCHHPGGLRRILRGNRRTESARAAGYSARG
jgi:Cupin domain